MRMTSPEKLILENQLKIMGALSVLLRQRDEVLVAQDMSRQCSVTSTVLHAAKTWPEER